MAKTNVTATASSTSVNLLLGLKIGRLGASIYNDDANAMHVIVGSTTVSSTAKSVTIGSSEFYETPWFYRGEAIVGIWDGNGSGYAHVTEHL